MKRLRWIHQHSWHLWYTNAWIRRKKGPFFHRSHWSVTGNLYGYMWVSVIFWDQIYRFSETFYKSHLSRFAYYKSIDDKSDGKIDWKHLLTVFSVIGLQRTYIHSKIHGNTPKYNCQRLHWFVSQAKFQCVVKKIVGIVKWLPI